jgi:sugar lactone lactonase YvrE
MNGLPELVLDARADLGEGPAWDASQGMLYWLDIHAGALHTFNPHDRIDSFIDLGEPVGCVAPSGEGNIILGLHSGLASLHLPTQKLVGLISPEKDLPGNRFNDGKCDPAGRFLAGTMDNAEKDASGSLYSYAPDGTLKTLLTGVRISNGMAWSPDTRIFYFIDTPTRQVTAFDYDLTTGEIARPRQVITVPQDLGWPDGMTSDTEGMLWVAMWGGAKLTRWDPARGALLNVIPIPAFNCTSCCFGGQGMTELFITSARRTMNSSQLAQYPLSGGLFQVHAGVQGMPTFQFGD